MICVKLPALTSKPNMEIIINRKDCEELLSVNKIRWSLLNRKNLILFTLYAVAGLFFLAAMALTLKDGERFWGPASSIGLSFVLLSAVYFSHANTNKALFLRQTQEYINRFNKQDEGVYIKITELIVSYRDFEAYSETKWTAFSHYKFHDGYVFLFTDKSIVFWVKRIEMSPENFDELRLFLSKTLQEKK